jgi:heat shock protein HtpX
MQTQPSLDEAADRLAHNATFVGLLPAVLIGAVLVLVHPVVGLVVAVALSIAWVLAVRARVASAPQRVLAGLTTSPLAPGAQPRLENLLEGLCATSGVASPQVSLVDAPSMNALVAAGRDDAHLVLTTALVDQLGRLELEGVLANLLGRVKDGSARYSTLVLALLGTSSRGTRLLGAHLGDQRAVLSDLAAVDLTRYPPGLMSALSTMAEHGTELPGAPAATVPLWLAPVQRDTTAEPVGELQPLSLRIAVLSEL